MGGVAARGVRGRPGGTGVYEGSEGALVPVYEYKCEECGWVGSEVRPMAQMEAETRCEECGGVCRFVMSKPGRFRRGSGWSARMDGAKMPGEA